MKDILSLSLKKFVIAETIGDIWLKSCAIREIVPYQRTLVQRVQIKHKLTALYEELNRKSPTERNAMIKQWEKEIFS